MDQLPPLFLDKFTLRDYQVEPWDAWQKGHRRIIDIEPRRSGKDMKWWQAALRTCLKETCLVFYVLPTYGQANRVIWSGITSSGDTFLELIPPQVIRSINSSEMKVTFKNGSILQCIAGDSHNTSIRGTNPKMVILSEFAYMKPDVYNTVSPILAANGGTVIITSTPFGKNHFWELYNYARATTDWWVYLKTVDDTKHIDPIELAAEKARLSPTLFAQEYYCSFEHGVEGAIYGRVLKELKDADQIIPLNYDPSLPVYLAMDIGISKGNETAIIWFQVTSDSSSIRLIDSYSNRGLGLDHYIEKIKEKPYYKRMDGFFAPHDMGNREWGSGAMSRALMASQLGIDFTVLERERNLEDGIERVMLNFPKLWIDSRKCKHVIDALENYYRVIDEDKNLMGKPIHNWASNFADALRYVIQALPHTQKSMSSEDFERAKSQAMYGNQGNLPWIFRDDRSSRR